VSPIPGTVLHVDLSTGEASRSRVPAALPRDYLGGSGVNGRLLYDLAPRGVDPLSPESPLLVGVGPLVAAGVPSAARVTFTSKSPLTGWFCDASAGGSIGSRLAGAGIDHLVLVGRAPRPSILVLGERTSVRLEDAAELWGLDPDETDRRLAARFGDASTARIGFAGERGVRFAGIVTGRERSSLSGRGGLGAVMGAKNLKSIVVTARPAPRAFEGEHRRELVAALLESPRLRMRAKRGTLDLLHAYAAMGDLRTRNYSAVASEEEAEAYEPEAIHSRHAAGRVGCRGCPTPCGVVYAGVDFERGRRAEFGALYALGPNLGLRKFEDALRLLGEADAFGLDAIELGGTLSAYAAAVEEGAVGGMEPPWGDVERLLDLTRSLVQREGRGAALADGAAAFARSVGLPRLAPHAKGLVGRPEKNLAAVLGQCVSTRGGDHMRAFPFLLFGGGNRAAIDRVLGPLPDVAAYDPLEPSGKGRVVWWHENFKSAVDASGFCVFSAAALVADGLFTPEDLASVLGDPGGGWDAFFLAGERAVQIQRAFNALGGATRVDDSPPWAASDLDREGMLDEYYRWRGLSAEGRPTRERLASVGMGDVARDAAAAGVLGSEGTPFPRAVLSGVAGG
jgi:aldehyde:ferredoxin oxidoreductase